MNKLNNEFIIPEEVIFSKIYFIRGQKVMIDRDLAELYGVKTKRLKEAVKRNIARFPDDFMFEMTKEEFENWRTQFATSKSDVMGLRYAPFCFSEQGLTMLSCVLNSYRAIDVNIRIIRVFTRLRDAIVNHKELANELEKIRQKLSDHENNFLLVFEYLKQFEQSKQQQLEQANRKRIGFKTD